jgi:flagellar motor switch protein FliG
MASASAMTAPALTGLQKSAVLLIALGDQASSELLRHLSEDEVQKVSMAIATLPPVSPELAEVVLEEFRQATNTALQVGQGGVDYARRILTNAFGPEGSKKHLERLPNPERDSSEQQQLQRVDPQMLARFVRSEHPQTVALILSRLNPAQAAQVLTSMEPAVRADVAMRIGCLDQISPAVISKISAVIGKKLKSLGSIQREPSGGARAVAEIFNQLDATLSDETLAQIEERNAPLVEEIRQKMFVFDDLLNIDSNGVKEVLSRADRRQLAVVRQLESEGVISRKKGGGGDEQYI